MSEFSSPEPEQIVVMDDLVEEVCWQLLAGSRFGRIAFVVDGAPLVLPFNFRVHGETLVFRCAASSMLHGLGRGSPVAVEIDHVDVAAETGWSVMLRGEAWEITDRSDAVDKLGDSVHAWAPGDRDRWLSVTRGAVSGRSISRRSTDWRPPFRTSSLDT